MATQNEFATLKFIEHISNFIFAGMNPLPYCLISQDPNAGANQYSASLVVMHRNSGPGFSATSTIQLSTLHKGASRHAALEKLLGFLEIMQKEVQDRSVVLNYPRNVGGGGGGGA